MATLNPINMFGKEDRTDGHWAGWIYASDADTGVWKWRAKSNYPFVAGITPTAGGIVFVADIGGNFYALDSSTGQKLWGGPLGTGGGIGGGVITYTVDGVQKVAVADELHDGRVANQAEARKGRHPGAGQRCREKMTRDAAGGSRESVESHNHPRGNDMSFFSDLLEKPANLSTESKYAVMNGYIYLAIGAPLIVWPGAVQTILMDRPFVGDEGAIFRVTGMALAVIGWLYVFGGRSGARQFGPASILDRVVLVPGVLVPLAIAGVFPHTLIGDGDSRPDTRPRCLGAAQSQARDSRAIAMAKDTR